MKFIKFTSIILFACLLLFTLEVRADVVSVTANLYCTEGGVVEGYGTATLNYGVVQMDMSLTGAPFSDSYHGSEIPNYDSHTLAYYGNKYLDGFMLQVCAWGNDGGASDFRCAYDYCYGGSAMFWEKSIHK